MKTSSRASLVVSKTRGERFAHLTLVVVYRGAVHVAVAALECGLDRRADATGLALPRTESHEGDGGARREGRRWHVRDADHVREEGPSRALQGGGLERHLLRHGALLGQPDEGTAGDVEELHATAVLGDDVLAAPPRVRGGGGAQVARRREFALVGSPNGAPVPRPPARSLRVG